MSSNGITIVREVNLGILKNRNLSKELESSTSLCVPVQQRIAMKTPPGTDNLPDSIVHKSLLRFGSPALNNTTTAKMQLDNSKGQHGAITSSTVAPLLAELQHSKYMESIHVPKISTESQVMLVNRGREYVSDKFVDADLSPDDEDRKRVKRERNKLAAARCRKRRIDQIETLQQQVNNWQEQNTSLQNEIRELKAQQNDLQFILDAHKRVCKGTFSEPQGHQPEIEESKDATHCIFEVKTESIIEDTKRHRTHDEAMDMEPNSTLCSSESRMFFEKLQRPQSLCLSMSKNANFIKSIEVSSETPTSEVAGLNLDALLEGRAGLIPSNILTPISISMTSNSLHTPFVVTSAGCGSQQMRSTQGYIINSAFGEMSSSNSTVTNLVCL